MKTPFDPRHLFRQKIVQALFESSFYNLTFFKKRPFKTSFSPILKEEKVQKKITDIVKNLPKIDAVIHDAASEWPIIKIAKVDLAILRLAVYELVFVKSAPLKVIVDEAVELAKEFGGETSSRFVNGALGKVTKNLSYRAGE